MGDTTVLPCAKEARDLRGCGRGRLHNFDWLAGWLTGILGVTQRPLAFFSGNMDMCSRRHTKEWRAGGV